MPDGIAIIEFEGPLSSSRPQTAIDDYEAIVSLPGRDGLPRIIVGGHAVNIWAEHYLKAEPQLSQYFPFHSKDLDLLGAFVDLEVLAKQTGFRVERAQKKVFIPSAGYLIMPRPGGETVKIEILKRIYGVSNEQVREWAVELEHHEKRVRVVDPITLLKAKTENAVHLPQNESGRERQDVKHVQVMILCVRAYLRESLRAVSRSEISPKQAVILHETALSYVSDETALKAAQMYGIRWGEVFPLKELHASKELKLANFRHKRLPRFFPETA